MSREEGHDYYVCTICGYVAESRSPDQRPIGSAVRDEFHLVA